MKNLRYFNFERNKYFYGKLLSVDDFDSEQRYMNDKRRIINRLIHGTGVVCGMNVVLVDDITISVENGFALDFSGREIVIEQPVTKKLSLIDGFNDYTEQDEANNNLYLCIEYDEKEKDVVHSIAGAKASSGSNAEYNKYAEGYHLYLTKAEPENENSDVESLYEETKTIFWKNGIRIKQTVPKIINGNQEFEVKITVEKMGQTEPIAFSYNLSSTCLQDGTDTTIRFNEADYKKSTKYEFTKKLKTLLVDDVTVRLSVVENSFQLTVGAAPISDKAKGFNTINIITGNVKNEIIDRYYKGAMDNVLRNTNQQAIYLAKLSIIRAGASYTIDSIEPMPFNQYVFNNTLAAAMNNFSLNDIAPVTSADSGAGFGKTVSLTKGGNDSKTQIATGSVVINLGIGGITGQKFFSQEISHGLGLGPVTIILGEAYNLDQNSNIVYGSSDIFEEKIPVVNASLAARVNVEKGTFSIGLKCLETTNERNVKVHWTAIKDTNGVSDRAAKDVIQIKPDMFNMGVRESHYFEALINGVNEKRVRWSVKEVDGGAIDDNGMYTAPNKAGVYEVIGQSIDNPELVASTYVIVRDL